MTLSAFWPANVPWSIKAPNKPLTYFLDHNAACFPDKSAIVFCDNEYTYTELKNAVDQVAFFLKQDLAIKKQTRVLLMGQNSPQFIIAYYAILKAGAVVVPVNAMSKANEIEYLIQDSGAQAAIVARDVYDEVQAVNSEQLQQIIVFNYKDILKKISGPLPSFIEKEFPLLEPHEKLLCLAEIINKNAMIPESLGADIQPDDMCVLPYTSGTTGYPKGCVHTHRTLLSSIYSSVVWKAHHAETVSLSAAPLFHLLGMQSGMNIPLFLGATVVMLPRWDIEIAARLIQTYKVSNWSGPPSMFIDFFSSKKIKNYNLKSLAMIAGGGAMIPSALSKKLKEEYNLVFNEAYGMTETAAFILANPPGHCEGQCLGLATQNVYSYVADPDTLNEQADGELGELVVSAPQVMIKYWNNDVANQESFFERDGIIYFRTGDLVVKDENGFYYIRDRLKRMVNVSGYKVWPTEVEGMMYSHSAIQEVCIVGIEDPKKGEQVKALIVLKEDLSYKPSAQEIIEWCRSQMANYKVPKQVEFVNSLAKSGTGKILWRQIQEEQNAN